METTETDKKNSHGLLKFLAGILAIWLFGWVIGPYIEQNIPTYKKIATVVEERGIDSAAYMYVAEAGSYEGEYYLADSFRHADRKDYGVTFAFLSGIVSCIGILGFGWRYIM